MIGEYRASSIVARRSDGSFGMIEDRSPPCKRPALRNVTNARIGVARQRNVVACSLLSLPAALPRLPPVRPQLPPAPVDADTDGDVDLDVRLHAITLSDPPLPPPVARTRVVPCVVLDAAAVQTAKGLEWRDHLDSLASEASGPDVAIDETTPLPDGLLQRSQDHLQRLTDTQRRCDLPGGLGSVTVLGTVGKGTFGYTLLAKMTRRGSTIGRVVVLKVDPKRSSAVWEAHVHALIASRLPTPDSLLPDGGGDDLLRRVYARAFLPPSAVAVYAGRCGFAIAAHASSVPSLQHTHLTSRLLQTPRCW